MLGSSYPFKSSQNLSKSSPKTLANLAIKQGIVTVPSEVWNDDFAQQLRQYLSLNGNQFCGGGFVQLERHLISSCDFNRRVDREKFKYIINQFYSNSQGGNQLDFFFELLVNIN